MDSGQLEDRRMKWKEGGQMDDEGKRNATERRKDDTRTYIDGGMRVESV